MNNVSFTDSAARRVAMLLEDEGNYNLKLRVYITGGGCSGFQYGFTFTEEVDEDDITVEKTLIEDQEGEGSSGGVTVQLVIDPLSMTYLQGSEIDFKETLTGSTFSVNNPNAKSTCGCGASFAI